MKINTPQIDNSRSTFLETLVDLRQGLMMYHLWGRLGWNDILQRYRRSLLGPLWITVSMAVLIGALGLLYAKLFKVDVAEYIPFLAIGFVLWQFISGILLDGCNVFVHSEGIIKQIKLPLSLHVYRVLWRNFLTLIHNSVVVIFVMVYFKISVDLGTLFALTLSFFLTPIIWNPSLIPDRAFILLYNPFFHFVVSIRAPLLGDPVGVETWWILISITIIGWVLVIPAISKMGRKLVYWL